MHLLLRAGFSALFFSTFPGPVLQILPFALTAGGIYWYRKIRGDNETPPAQKCWRVLFVCYAAGVVCMVFFYSSIRYFWGFLAGTNKFSNVFTVFLWKRTANFIPDFYKRFSRERILNLILFLPFGFLYPLAKQEAAWTKTVAAGIISVVLIEVLQPIFARAFDVNDLILNSIGVLVSATVFFLIKRAGGRFRSLQSLKVRRKSEE